MKYTETKEHQDLKALTGDPNVGHGGTPVDIKAINSTEMSRKIRIPVRSQPISY